ncbi:MAG: cobyrinate a,c-diamide synthase [Xenococcaceae cyanobacterium MO_188.B29]|nr:cobyrinate a,c-diamide synthase [Xenococcaceae cyanobacterium MO_188.B29]
MALLIAGERSGVGKTTVTLSLLSYLSQQNYQVQSFKVGPDYIDPMFHQAVTHRPCRNLDPVITSEAYVQSCFARHSQKVDFVLVEGVMGLFDGVTRLQKDSQKNATPNVLVNDYGSTAHIARLLKIPLLLVLDCSRLSSSVAAIVHGYSSLDSRITIAGIVLNRVGSDRHLELLQDALAIFNIPILGVLRRHKNITIPDRHLGLVPTDEIAQLKQIFTHLAHIGQTCFGWSQILPLLKPPTKQTKCRGLLPIANSSLPIRIAIARDRAFNFYYQDNLDILAELGAELIFWSPLQDETLPKNIHGLYFGGGFPEVFAQQLAANQPLLNSIYRAIQAGIPTYAECGGLMYLCQKLVDFSQETWSMVGVIPTTVEMTTSLTLGYRQAKALQNTPLIKKNETVWGHEFHHSQLVATSAKPLWQLQGYKSTHKTTTEGWQLAQLHASYLHLHFGEYLELPQQFLYCCLIKNNQL